MRRLIVSTFLTASVLTLSVVLYTGCSGMQTSEPTSHSHVSHDAVTDAVDLIENCPNWLDVTQSRPAADASIIRHLDDLSHFNPPTLRQAIVTFIALHQEKGTFDVRAMAKLFILNRYFLKVPEWVSLENAVHFGGWTGVPQENNQVNLLWPLTVNKDGKFELIGRTVGYMGPNFAAVEEFDYFMGKYGLRRQLERKPPQ